MINSPLLTQDVLDKPMISVVSFLKKMRQKAGEGLIDLSVGNPDLPPCREAIETLAQQSLREDIHGYGNFDGQPALLASIRNYYQARYGVTGIGDDQINVIRGVRNVLFSVSYIFVAPGDLILVPGVGYQSYYLAALFNHAQPYFVPMTREDNFVPAIWDLPREVLQKAKLLYLNYPNNPTGSQITREQLTRIVELCRRYEILLCYDNAYNEILFDGLAPISLLEIPGAMEIGIEITSMSKLTGLAGWRIAFAVANPTVSSYLWNYNAVSDSAVFDGFQLAGAKALDHVVAADDGGRLSRIYQTRRDIITSGFDAAGIAYFKPQGSFYVWLDVPPGHTDFSFAEEILEKEKVLLTPGSYYGDAGKQNLRLSLTADEDTLRQAAQRIARLV